MGRDYEREETSASTKLTYLLVGGGIGAILALLFAPKSGEELREDIADATRKGIEKSKVAASQIQEKAGEYYEVSREKAGELYQTAQEKAGELSEKAKSVAASTANPFTAAIDAGKHVVMVNVEGELFAVSNVCPHAGHSRRRGRVSGASKRADVSMSRSAASCSSPSCSSAPAPVKK